MKQYQVTIGLEIHAQLKTESKMFCGCRNDPDEVKPNINICPICVGHPGTLPVINRQAVYQLLRIGQALDGRLADFTQFDRKHYFYPDIPKGYQISQYKYPLVAEAKLHGVEIERIHLEEDTARSIHDQGEYSLVDFNRSGLPLMELVTKPVIKSGAEAADFARELRLLLRYLGAGEANMEKGQMRVEANLSLSLDRNLGTKVEVKNLNSFKSVEKAVAYEIERQSKLLAAGESIIQQTLGWDERKQVTVPQRSKEESHDYRYFPEPDLPPMQLSEVEEFSKERLVASLPELPWDKRARWMEAGVKPQQAEVLINDQVWGEFFELVLKELGSEEDQKLIATVANYITSDLAGLVQEDLREIGISPINFAKLIRMIKAGELSSRAGKDLLAKLVENDEDPESLADREGLLQSLSEGELGELVQEVIVENRTVVEDYLSGKDNSLQFLIGQGMKKSGGRADPTKLKSKLQEVIPGSV